MTKTALDLLDELMQDVERWHYLDPAEIHYRLRVIRGRVRKLVERDRHQVHSEELHQ